MNKNVNVLAVMDGLSALWRDESKIVGRCDPADELDYIHAAVAELIEATTAYLDGRKWYNPLYANKRQFETFAAIESRLTAALVRVRSAA